MNKSIKTKMAVILTLLMIMFMLPLSAFAKGKLSDIKSDKKTDSSEIVGTVKNNVYVNEFFGCKVPLPKGYTYADYKQLAEENAVTADVVKDSDAILKKVEKGETFTVACAENDDGENLLIMLMKDDSITSVEKDLFGEDSQDYYKEVLAGQGFTVKKIGVEKDEVAGEKQPFLIIQSVSGKVKLYQKLLIYQKDDYFLFFNASTLSEDAADDIYKKVEKLD